MPNTDRDGSYYGRERVTREIAIERTELADGDEAFRFVWDGPKLQPFAGQWRSVKNQAIQDGVDWLDMQRIYVEEDVTDHRAPNEHAPGNPCTVQSCPKPSTFDDLCAKHYCVTLTAMMGMPVYLNAQ